MSTVRVAPMPDEPAVAHAGRMALFMGLTASPSNDRWIREMAVACASVLENAPRLTQLASIAGMTTEEYARQHSLLGLDRLASSLTDVISHGAEKGARFTRRFGMVTQKPHAHLCLKCVSEDIEYWKFSWYRRAHQVQGIDWCPSHHEPLLKVVSSAPWSRLPQHWVEEGSIEEKFQNQPLIKDKFETRFIEIACELLQSRQPFELRALTEALRSRARGLGMRTSEVGVKSNLSDLVLRTAPSGWVKRHWPKLQEKQKGAIFFSLDNVLMMRNIPSKGYAYLTALTALWDTSAEVHKIFRSLECRQQPSVDELPNSRCPPRPVQYWHGEIWNQYLRYQGRARAMAPELGMDHTYLRAKLNQLGMPSLRGVANSPHWRAFLRFESGESLSSACEAEGANLEDVEALIRVSCARVATAARQTLSPDSASSKKSKKRLSKSTKHPEKRQG